MALSKHINKVFSYESLVHAISGATGGVIAMTFFYPLDTVRSRLQLEDPNIKEVESTLKIFYHILKTEGICALYRGLIPVLESLCISNFVYFYAFHSLKILSANGENSKNNAFKDLLIGAISGIINVLTTTPFWVVNTRIKMKDIKRNSNKNSNYNGLMEGLLYIAKTEGMQGLWAGTVPSLMLVINPALQFMMYELIKRNLQKSNVNLTGLSYLGIGALSKAFATILTYPLQLVQTKMRHNCVNITKTDANNIKSNNCQGIFEMLLKITETQGFFGIYRGMEAKILQTVLTAALMFAAYEKIARNVNKIMLKTN